MDNPEEHRLYPAILKMVLWDEPEERIQTKLEANSLDNEVGQALLSSARKERLTTIRKDHIRTMGLGFVSFLLSALLFWFGRHYLILPLHFRLVTVLSGLLMGASLLGLLNGVISYCSASSKRGSVADDF